jgi:hypothetical protein
MRLQAEGDVSVFVEGLGPGQLVGRQALASVNYGDIQLSICERKGNIEVEVIRARNLMVKQQSRILPGEHSSFSEESYCYDMLMNFPAFNDDFASYLTTIIISLLFVHVTLDSNIRKSPHVETPKVRRKSKNCFGEKNSRSSLSAAAHLPRRL